jgi:hypothetical protein
VLLGFVASQRHQPSLRLRRDGRAQPVVKCGQYPVGKRSFDATLDGLMITKLSSDQEKTRVLTVGEQHLRRSTRLAGSVREREITFSFPISSSVIANSTACRHCAVLPFLVRATANEESTR